jgi:hypothetical protein
MGGRANAGGNGDNGLADAAIYRWLYPESPPNDVLSWSSLIFVKDMLIVPMLSGLL